MTRPSLLALLTPLAGVCLLAAAVAAQEAAPGATPGTGGVQIVIPTRPPVAVVEPPPPPAGCVAETEPNDRPEEAPALSDEPCVSGLLEGMRDQDLYFYEVAPQDGLVTWSVTVRSVPGTVTSAHFIPVISAPGVFPIEVVALDDTHVDSDFWPDTPPTTRGIRLAPGRYLLGISRTDPLLPDVELTDDLGYWVQVRRAGSVAPAGDVEPNDDAASAGSVAGAFALSGDLAASTDVYRWSVSAADAGTPWRLEVDTSLRAPLTLELLGVDGAPIAMARAAVDGAAVLHDLGLEAGDHLVRLSPAASQAQPYELRAVAVTEEGVDPEPNDTAELAIPIDPGTRTATGRLTSDQDVDRYLVDVDHALAAGLVDMALTWSGGGLRDMCLQSEAGVSIGCAQGRASAALSGVMLPPGRFVVEVRGQGDLDDRYQLAVRASDVAVPAPETEPNDDPATAGALAGAFSVGGELTGSVDVFAWTLGDADAAGAWRLDASGTPGLGATMELLGPDGRGLATARLDSGGTARIWDLRLPAGTYLLRLSATGGEAPRYLLRATPETAADLDPEPNDTLDRAVAIDPATQRARGRIAPMADEDVYLFDIDEAMAETLTDVTIDWPGAVATRACLSVYQGGGLQCRDGTDGVALTHLLLPAGRYALEVGGFADPETRYEVRVTQGRPPSADHEAEPNDTPDRPTSWDPASVMRGTSRDGDVDSYRVRIEGAPVIWRLELTGTGVEAPEWRQPDGTSVGSVTVAPDGSGAVIEDLYLVAGEHLVSVSADGDYALVLTGLGPPDLHAEREPNDDPDHAASLPMGATRSGRLPTPDDVDVYRFSLVAHEHVVITAEPQGSAEAPGGAPGIALEPTAARLDLEVLSSSLSLARSAGDRAGGATVIDALLPPGDHEVWVRTAFAGEVAYELRLERADPFQARGGTAPSLPLGLTLVPEAEEVAAYLGAGQQVTGALALANGSDASLDISLDAATSDERWTVDLPASATVPAGGAIELPLLVHVPPDAWGDVPVRITVRARTPDGAQATGGADITPTQDAAAVGPVRAWPLPDAMLGGLDVASALLGGEPVSPRSSYQGLIHDGAVIAGGGYADTLQLGPVELTVDLAGDEPVPVAGMTLDPLGGPGVLGERPRAFQLLLSTDGETYQKVFAGEAAPRAVEQAFPLEEPVPARFARLRIESTWAGTDGPFVIGEWKVVAEPGVVPSGVPGIVPGEAVDIAAKARGGHVVWTDPPIYSGFVELLDEADAWIAYSQLQSGRDQRVVLGFADDRAAQVVGLGWVDQVGSDAEARFASVEVEASDRSPLGPWRPLGTWSLERGPDGSVAPFELAEPAWARFLSLRLVPAPGEATMWELPGVIRVLERPTDATYRSILGQWGRSSAAGILERLEPPPQAVTDAEDVDAPDTPAAAEPLALGESVRGRVSRAVDTDWYRVTIPAGQNRLRLDLRTERTNDIRLVVQGPEGARIPMDAGPSDVPGAVRWEGNVEPGATYLVGLEQPILSVVIAFDTSPSVRPWIPQIRSAVRSFASGIRPGLEALRVLPYEQPAMPDAWTDQAFLVQSAIDAWATTEGSSCMACAIEDAVGLLGERDGTRAILVLGDALGAGFQGGLPAAVLEESGASIFPIQFGGTDDRYVTTDIMQDVALVNGGAYQYATSIADVERGFERMASQLRRPAEYALAADAVHLAPGSIAVVAAEGAQVRIGGVAVGLVLDTSGSMLKELGRSDRITVAKRSLVRLVERALPEGLPVALRTFKAGRRSCGTVLTVPLGPLDRAAMVRRIQRLRLHRGTKTPLGAAIGAVREDLASATGPKVVVVVTDGAETCKGDPEAAIRSLVEAGFEATVNIVGFALEDEALKATMASWAEAGGGVFVDARDQAGLSEAIASVLRAPFRVLDATGTVVGRGIVGAEPVPVPPGAYRLEVLAEPPVTLEVVVGPGQPAVLTVGDAAP